MNDWIYKPRVVGGASKRSGRLVEVTKQGDVFGRFGHLLGWVSKDGYFRSEGGAALSIEEVGALLAEMKRRREQAKEQETTE